MSKNNHLPHFNKKLLTVGLLLTVFGDGMTAKEKAISPDRLANTVILEETAVKNLRIETVMVEEKDFESKVFSVGRIEEIPAHHHSITSRISGRTVEVNAHQGEQVSKGDVLVKVESRQPGNPPPTIELKALADGLVIRSGVHVGQPVEPDTDLMDISDRSQMWAVAQIPEREAARVKPGTHAYIFIPAIGGKPIKAKLLRYGVTANREAGTIEGVFQIANPEMKLQPGMRAEFSIVLETHRNVMAVPKAAVQGDPARRVVYVKDYDLPNAFVRVPLVLGENNGDSVEVLSGLFPGDEVVTRGSYSLGFVGGGSGISLKDALDAAHGHEHNEDGSEMTAKQKSAKKHSTNEGSKEAHNHGSHSGLQIYALISTVIALVLVQRLWTQRNSAKVS